jgi:hypothetical protein
VLSNRPLSVEVDCNPNLDHSGMRLVVLGGVLAAASVAVPLLIWSRWSLTTGELKPRSLFFADTGLLPAATVQTPAIVSAWSCNNVFRPCH